MAAEPKGLVDGVSVSRNVKKQCVLRGVSAFDP